MMTLAARHYRHIASSRARGGVRDRAHRETNTRDQSFARAARLEDARRRRQTRSKRRIPQN
jgi:hypothetical protein